MSDQKIIHHFISCLLFHVLKNPMHYSDAIVSAMAFQLFAQVQIKENIKASLAFVRESTGDRWIPLTKGQ